MTRFASLALVTAALALTSAAYAGPVVTFTTSGTSGNYTLDFSVTNNLGNTNDIYFFGVQLPARDIVASPGGFDPNIWLTWDNSPYGGSSTIYNNNWIDFTFSSLPNGTTLSGFQAHTTSLTAPTSVPYFAYAFGGSYFVGDNFNSPGNPGFEGLATGADVTAVPEPGVVAFGILSAGSVLGLIARKRKA